MTCVTAGRTESSSNSAKKNYEIWLLNAREIAARGGNKAFG